MADFDVEELIKQAKIEAMNELIEEAYASGISTRSMDEMLQDARDRAKAQRKTPGDK